MGTWALLKEITKKRFSSEEPGKKRIDVNYPLGIRIGGVIQISTPEFILAKDQLKIKGPDGDLYVVSYGRFKLGDFIGHRFYLSQADSLYMLQVIENSTNGQIDECTLFSLHDEVFPANSEDWDFWLDDSDGYIGYSEFQLKDGTPYRRVWDNDSQEVTLNGGYTRIPPIVIDERMNLDPYGDNVRNVTYTAMLYEREVDAMTMQVTERLLVGVAEDSDGASVQFSIGIPIQPIDIKILF